MSGIIIATVVLAVIGIVVGVSLVSVGRKFHVDTDPRVTEIRDCLPGNNCGACGYAGCDAMAEAIAAGEAPVNGCPVGGGPVAEKIGKIMGVDAAAEERKIAFVRCKGSCDVTKERGEYVGIRDCRAAVLSGISIWECDYGCVGFGSCVNVCPENAIHVENGVAIVDRKKCIGCGLCVKACPKHLIELIPASRTQAVRCSNHDKGRAVRNVCNAGCIGCGLCVRQCAYDAIHVDGNLAHIDYAKCELCGKCDDKCPAHIIADLREGN